ncbi:hypothetical protein K523DRAFT_90574 [Schizophyllum commune Tattone D]|nr:hypothetical protein K523DRAFT_90574 [Schizophyllum commune Tattone D]
MSVHRPRPARPRRWLDITQQWPLSTPSIASAPTGSDDDAPQGQVEPFTCPTRDVTERVNVATARHRRHPGRGLLLYGRPSWTCATSAAAATFKEDPRTNHLRRCKCRA